MMRVHHINDMRLYVVDLESSTMLELVGWPHGHLIGHQDNMLDGGLVCTPFSAL